MKPAKSSKTAKILIALVAVGLAVALGWLIYSLSNESPAVENNSGVNEVEPAPPELSDNEAAQKQKFIESQSDDSSADKDASQKPASLVIDASQTGSTITVTTEISSIGDGTCSLIITNGSKEYSDSASVIYQRSYSTCAGFSVPKDELGSGEWSVSIEVGGRDGRKISGSTTVEVR